MDHKKIKVLYIAGPSRSGSTILSNILGEFDGFFNAGEVIDIWDRGLQPEGRCGCGVHISRCEIWRAVLDKIETSSGRINVEAMIRLRDHAVHSRKIPWYLFVPGARARLERRLHEYLSTLEKLYRAIFEATGCRVIIDPSKNAGYAFILSLLPNISLYILHLIRDPRATAYSWQRRKEGLWREKPINSVLKWGVRNVITEMQSLNSASQYRRLYYEDFIASPAESVKQILELLGESYANPPFISDHEVSLGTNHSIFGNPNRHNAGLIELKLDDEWKKMRRSDKFTITAFAWPLLLRHGYPLLGQNNTAFRPQPKFSDIK